MIDSKRSHAKDFQISNPFGGSLTGWLNTRVTDGEKRGEATVRDGANSIEVIVLQNIDEELHLPPWIHSGRPIPRDKTPDDKFARAAAGRFVRLPSIFSADWMIDRVIGRLEQTASDENLESWQKSHWLRKELFLILDDKLEAEVCGYILKYDKKLGLMSKKTRV